MHRMIFVLLLTIGLMACRGNDKVVGAWEINDVYRSTNMTPNLATGQKVYVGPPINTMDANDTYEMYNLRTEISAQGVKSYELMVLLSYYAPWRYYESASLENVPSSTFKVVSREAGICDNKGCMFKELLSISLSEAFLKKKLDHGFQMALSSKTGAKTNLYVPAQYIKGYLKAVDGTSN